MGFILYNVESATTVLWQDFFYSRKGMLFKFLYKKWNFEPLAGSIHVIVKKKFGTKVHGY